VADCPTSADALVGAAEAVNGWTTASVTVFELAVRAAESVTLQLNVYVPAEGFEVVSVAEVCPESAVVPSYHWYV
jgi:Ni,Fe-hydrogenase III component G